MATNFKRALFDWVTLRLMTAKYVYYHLPHERPIMEDESYDRQEKEWHSLGRELGLLDEDDTSPCVDYPIDNPLHSDVLIMVNYLVYMKDKPSYEDLCIRYEQY